MNQSRASPFLNSVPVLGCLLWGRVHRLPCLGRCRWLERQEPESTSQSRRKPRGTKSSRAAVLESFSHRAWDLRVGNSLRGPQSPPPPTPRPTPALTHHLHPIASISSTEQKPQCWPPLPRPCPPSPSLHYQGPLLLSVVKDPHPIYSLCNLYSLRGHQGMGQ